jgi:hypothetical protein
MGGTSAWPTGCSGGSLGLLVSAIVGEGSADVCGCLGYFEGQTSILG